MEPCRACGGKRISHTETGAEKRCNRKTQRNPQPVLWHPIKRHTHIKRKNNLPKSGGASAEQQLQNMVNNREDESVNGYVYIEIYSLMTTQFVGM
jgi:hypothetical protein